MNRKTLLTALCFLIASCAFAQSLTVTLTPSNFNGYNIACFGNKDGTITTTITGGTPPYTYKWSNEEITQTITQLPSGYYHVVVIDANGNGGKAEITLDEPLGIDFGMGPQFYANGYNTSCFFCADGAINIDIKGGITPYTFAWNDGSTFQNRTGLLAKYYQVIVTDANGCIQKRDGITLTAPDRDDWTMSGNTNTNPATQFLGTLDSKDLSFRTNNVERFKIKSNGVAEFKFDVNIQTAILFKNNKVITYQPAQNNLPDIMSFGAAPNPTPFAIANCITPQLNTFQFNGTIQLYGNSAAGGNLNVMEVGFDGYNSIIDATGNSTDPNSNRLLLNYYCGRDVFVGNRTSGDLTANYNLFTYGKMGIGTNTATEALQIGDRFVFHNGGTKVLALNFTYDGQDKYMVNDYASGIFYNGDGSLSLKTAPSGTATNVISWTEGIHINNNGNVGIGVGNPASKLEVCGTVKANQFNVQSGWCDFVFEKEHNLLTISEIKSFIEYNKHLPGVPTTKEVESNGINVGEMFKIQMQKIEELTLYIIQQDDKIKILESRLNSLKKD